MGMENPGGLAVFVTSHGFGHLNRTAAVLNRLPETVPITIRAHADLIGHWNERLRRQARVLPYVSDAGALGAADDSAAIDGPATLESAARIHADAMARVDQLAQELREEGTVSVLCDAPAMPLAAARAAKIPCYLLANFTWADIYAPHAEVLGPDAQAFVLELRRTYRLATALFRAEPALRMGDLKSQLDVGMVVTPGHDRRSELRRELGLSAREKLVYFYVGRYGQANLDWRRLERMAAMGVHFLAFHEPPIGRLENVHVVSADRWTGADLAASSDAMVAKAGYGTACEAMVAGTPIIYPPRIGFAEHRVLDRALRAWGGGTQASMRQFAELRLESLLKRAFEQKPGPPPFPADGAARIAEYLTENCRAAARVRRVS